MRTLTLVFLIAAACQPEAERKRDTTSTATETASSASGRHLKTEECNGMGISSAECAASTPPAPTSADAAPATSASDVAPVRHGSGLNDWGDPRDPRKVKVASIRMGATSVTGRLPPEVIQRIVRQSFGRLRTCYEPALLKQPTPFGRIVTGFTIDATGKVKDVKATGDLADKEVVACIEKVFASLSYPQPESGIVKVSYPAVFAPPEYKFTIGGKNSIQVEEVDVVKALEAAGYKVTGASDASLPSQTLSRFKAEKGGVTFSITLDPAAKLPIESYEKLKAEAVILEDGAWCLIVESTDKAASQTLVDAIHKKLERK